MTSPGKPLEVLVVDDSVVVRSIVRSVLTKDPGLHVDIARNGRAALEAIAVSVPDFVVLDIEMPELDGLSTLREIRKIHPRLPVVMFSTLTERGAAVTLEALAAGANDYLPKPVAAAGLEAMREQLFVDLTTRIEALCRRTPAPAAPVAPPPPVVAPRGPRTRPVELVVIGSSTGGPNALTLLFSQLPEDLPVPVVVVQHMPPTFTMMLAKSIDAKSPMSVAEGSDGARLAPGHAWIAPGGFHSTIVQRDGAFVIATNQDPPECSVRPAVDVLFRSAASTHGDGVLAVVLTGMGVDGCAGATVLRAAGAQVIVQDEPSSIVWGMPGAIVRAGLADAVLPLESIAAEIVRRVARTPRRPAVAATRSSS